MARPLGSSRGDAAAGCFERGLVAFASLAPDNLHGAEAPVVGPYVRGSCSGAAGGVALGPGSHPGSATEAAFAWTPAATLRGTALSQQRRLCGTFGAAPRGAGQRGT